MQNINSLLTSAQTLWVSVAVLSVLVVGFLLGRRLLRKVDSGSDLDRRITGYMPQNKYGTARGVRKGGWYRSGSS